MSKREQLDILLKKGNGYLKTSDVVSSEISRTYLSDYVRSRNLERVAHGLYKSPGTWGDDMYIIQHRYSQAIFSHETAAFLLGLVEREPTRLVVTLPAGTRATILTKQGIRVHKVKHELFELGLISIATPAGNTVRAYSAERTICDFFRNRNSGDTQGLQVARKYLKSKEIGKDIPLLMRYAKQFSIDQTIRNYLEIAL